MPGREKEIDNTMDIFTHVLKQDNLSSLTLHLYSSGTWDKKDDMSIGRSAIHGQKVHQLVTPSKRRNGDERECGDGEGREENMGKYRSPGMRTFKLRGKNSPAREGAMTVDTDEPAPTKQRGGES